MEMTPDAQGQLIPLAQPREDLERSEPAVLVVNGGDSSRGGNSEALARGVHHLGHSGAYVAVAERPGGVLAQHSRRLAALVPIDDAALWLEGTIRSRQRRAVQPQGVVVAREQSHRRIGRHAVERSSSWRLGPVAVTPADAPEPATRRNTRDGLGDRCQSVVERVSALEPDLALRERPGGEVHVGVRESGHDAAAGEVDPLRAGDRPECDVPVVDGQLARERRRRVERADGTPMEDEIGAHATATLRCRDPGD